jgi:hypothetical protein
MSYVQINTFFQHVQSEQSCRDGHRVFGEFNMFRFSILIKNAGLYKNIQTHGKTDKTCPKTAVFTCYFYI